MSGLSLQLPLATQLTDEQFEQLAAVNNDLRPTRGETGNRNFEVYIDLGNWNRQNRSGKAFGSSTGFRLPNGATFSPDASWVSIDRWEALTQEQRKKFLPLCPDFAIEILLETDDLKDTQEKMQEYLDQGLRLGWLINPQAKQVEIYRHNQAVEVLRSPLSLFGEDVLPGFELNLPPIFA